MRRILPTAAGLSVQYPGVGTVRSSVSIFCKHKNGIIILCANTLLRNDTAQWLFD
jgi:hypothetical protein